MRRFVIERDLPKIGQADANTLSGFPANKITEIHRMIDPTTAGK